MYDVRVVKLVVSDIFSVVFFLPNTLTLTMCNSNTK